MKNFSLSKPYNYIISYTVLHQSHGAYNIQVQTEGP